MKEEDLALLSKVLVWRVAQAAPEDEPRADVPLRLAWAGLSFRRRTRPFTAKEVEKAARRLAKASTG